jgi:hypothetical protein
MEQDSPMSHARVRKIARATSCLVALLTAAVLIYFLFQRIYYEVAISLATLAIFIYIQFILDRRPWLRNPPPMQLFCSLLVFVSATFGRFFFLYSVLPGFDKAVHFLYGIGFCIVGFAVFYRINPGHRQEVAPGAASLFLFATCFAIACSFFWEVYEYAGDRLLGTDMQRWQQGAASGVNDTMLDMLAALLGTNLVAIFAILEFKRDPARFYRRRIAAFMPADSAPSHDQSA